MVTGMYKGGLSDWHSTCIMRVISKPIQLPAKTDIFGRHALHLLFFPFNSTTMDLEDL